MKFQSQRFDRAAATYDRYSQIQQAMGDLLLRMATEASFPILELGCGTGLFTRKLRKRFPNGSLLATDVSPRMLQAASESLADETVQWACFDAEGGEGEATSLPAEIHDRMPFGCIASNALAQWFPNLSGHFRLVRTLLSPQGSYLLSGFSRDNFPELQTLLRAEPFGYRDFPGHTQEDVRSATANAGFILKDWKEESVLETFPDVEAFLSAIRGLGAARRPEGILTRSKLAYLKRAYLESYPREGGIQVTWKPWYALLSRLG